MISVVLLRVLYSNRAGKPKICLTTERIEPVGELLGWRSGGRGFDSSRDQAVNQLDFESKSDVKCLSS